MTGARWLETDTLENHDLSAAHEVGSYTADADRLVAVQVLLDTVAGSGDYVWYATLQVGGSGSAYVFLPKTTSTAASGETAIGGQSLLIGVRNADVLKVYVDCLAADTSVDAIVRFFEVSALQPATADRTLVVSSGGAANADAVAISTDATAADRLEAMLDATPTGAVVDDNDPDPTTTAFETNLTEATNDHYNGCFVLFYSGALLGQSRKISDYDGTTKIITVGTAFTEAPANNDAFMILGRSE